jgi:hypothetical protein
MVICRVRAVLYAGGNGKEWVDEKDFSTGDKTPYRASGFLSGSFLPLLLGDVVDTLKKTHSLEPQELTSSLLTLSSGLRVEFRGEISKPKQECLLMRREGNRQTESQVLDGRIPLSHDPMIPFFTELFQTAKFH